jgi:uncharacterized protein YycO
MAASDLLRAENTLDYALLRPGDIVLVANPTDMPIIRYTVFWSHVGLVTEQGDVIDAVRERRGEYLPDAAWFQVRRSPFDSYRKSYDVLALRPRCPAETRLAAVRYAETKVGAPYASSVPRILFGRKDESSYSCASLMWQAYARQGVELFSVPSWLSLNVAPLALDRNRALAVVGCGTRYLPLPREQRRLRVERWWFRRVVGANIRAGGE